MKNKIDISYTLKVVGCVFLMINYVGVFKFFAELEGSSNGLGVFCLTFLGCLLATSVYSGILCIIFQEVSFKEGYYVIERD